MITTMAEYLDLLAGLQGNADEESGDVESPAGYFARFGDRIVLLRTTFVWVERFTTEQEACDAYAAMDTLYGELLDDDD